MLKAYGLWRNTYGSKMPKETVTRGEKMENVSFFFVDFSLMTDLGLMNKLVISTFMLEKYFLFFLA